MKEKEIKITDIWNDKKIEELTDFILPLSKAQSEERKERNEMLGEKYRRMRKCKDFVIFQVRYYADKNLLKKYRKSDQLPPQHHERAKLHVQFMWDFIDFVSKKENDYWYNEYGFDAKTCALEEIEDDHGIVVEDHEGERLILVPVERQDVIGWLYKNINTPFKIRKKVSLYSIKYGRNLKWNREWAKAHNVMKK